MTFCTDWSRFYSQIVLFDKIPDIFFRKEVDTILETEKGYDKPKRL